MRYSPILILLTACNPFEGYWIDGQKRELQVQLRGEKWSTHYQGHTILAAGGTFNLSCRGTGSRKLWVRSRNECIVVPEEFQKSGKEPAAESGNRFRVTYTLTAPAAGQAILDFGEGSDAVDSVPIEVKKVDRFHWSVGTERLRDRRKSNNSLELFIGDAIELRIEYVDERSWSLIGIGAYEYSFLDGGATEPSKTTFTCNVRIGASEGPSNSIHLEAKAQGRTALVLQGVGGSGARLQIPILVR